MVVAVFVSVVSECFAHIPKITTYSACVTYHVSFIFTTVVGRCQGGTTGIC